MPDNLLIDVENENIENKENQEPLTDNQEQLADNENSNAPDNQDIYPDGFDAEIYDLTTNSVKMDKIKERFDRSADEIDKLKKQNIDLRKIISKGKEAVDIKDYELNYKPDSKFERYYNDNEETKETLASFNEMAKNAGLNLEQHKMIADFFNETMAKAGVFDTRTEEEIRIQQEDWIKNEKAKLGKDADKIINRSVEFVNNYGMFNEEEKKELLGFIGKGAIGAAVVDKLRMSLFGNNIKDEIPTDVNVGGLADDYSLAREYNDSKTSDIRRMQIIEERIKAGRTNPLPIV